MKGFTLIETMVAITILTLAISGSFLASNSALVSAENVHDQLIASYLAQEGVEYVRMMRDNEYLSAFDGGGNISVIAWNNFLNGSDNSSITKCHSTTPNPAWACTLDPTQSVPTTALQICGDAAHQPATCPQLYLNSAHVYTQQQSAGNTRTQFTRTIQAVDVFGSSGNDVQVISKVQWYFHATPYYVTVIDHLTPWQ